jgi:PadR family transcriptional regulator, regulatory protein PadR
MPLLPSTKELLVLSLLAEHGDLYGLELVEWSNFRLKRGTVYVTLGRMEGKGLVRSFTDREPTAHAGLPRPRYRITTCGQRALQAQALLHSVLGGARVKA